MADEQLTDAHKREKLAALIADLKTCMMVTVDAGDLRARPMATAELEKTWDGNELWFATDRDSGKVHDIQSDARVCLAYAKPGSNSWVSVTGTASIIDDRARIKALWSPMWKAWFKGPDDPNLTLIRVTPTEAEYWDDSSSRLVVAFKLLRAMASDERQYRAENERVRL